MRCPKCGSLWISLECQGAHPIAKCCSCGHVQGGPPKRRRPKKSTPLGVKLGVLIEQATNREGGS